MGPGTLIETLTAAGELPPTLVFSAFDAAIYGERLLRVGARGYVTKDAPIERVVEAVRGGMAYGAGTMALICLGRSFHPLICCRVRIQTAWPARGTPYQSA